MEAIIGHRVSWLGLLVLGIGLLALYFTLRIASRLAAGASVSSPGLKAAQRALRGILLLYEPLALLGWSIFFIFINPPFHATLLGLLVLGGYPHIRNYLSGRLLRLGHPVFPGKKLRSGKVEGIASRMGNLGLYLQADDGLHYLSYSRLLSEGYTLLSGEEVSGAYHLSIKQEEAESAADPAVQLMDILATTPYLDWNHRPEWITGGGADGRLELRVVLKQESYLRELMQLLEELGFSCRVV